MHCVLPKWEAPDLAFSLPQMWFDVGESSPNGRTFQALCLFVCWFVCCLVGWLIRVHPFATKVLLDWWLRWPGQDLEVSQCQTDTWEKQMEGGKPRRTHG